MYYKYVQSQEFDGVKTPTLEIETCLIKDTIK